MNGRLIVDRLAACILAGDGDSELLQSAAKPNRLALD